MRTPNPPRGAHPRREVGVGVWVARPASRRLRKSHCGRCVLAARPGSCQLRPERARVGCVPEPSAGSWAHPLRPGPAQRKGPGAQVLVGELRLGWGHRTTKGRPRTSEAAKLLTDPGKPPLPQPSPQADRFSGLPFAAPLPHRGWSLWVGGFLNFVSSWCGEAAGPFGRRAPGVLERAVTWRASDLRGGRILPGSVGLRAQMPGAGLGLTQRGFGFFRSRSTPLDLPVMEQLLIGGGGSRPRPWWWRPWCFPAPRVVWGRSLPLAAFLLPGPLPLFGLSPPRRLSPACWLCVGCQGEVAGSLCRGAAFCLCDFCQQLRKN